MCARIFRIVLFISIFAQISFGQQAKRGSNWALGFWPVVTFDFNSSLQIDTLVNVNAMYLGSCISETTGSLLFYSAGFIVVNSDGILLENGNKINSPYGTVLCDYLGGGSNFPQTSIILPRKGNQYYVFSTGVSDSIALNWLNQVTDLEFDVLNYSIVDMDSNAGKGKVIEKNKVLADKQHYFNVALHAVKHANGRDWWLLKADCNFNRYQEFLVREDTILGPFYLYPPVMGDFCTWKGTLKFSNDGRLFASSMYGTLYSNPVIYDHNRVDLYDFDRCDGTINFRNYYMVPYDINSFPSLDYKFGICFSPNDNLLYMSNKFTVYQIDVHDTSMNNAILIHGPDTTMPNFPWYDQMEVAPDGRLYIGNFNGTRKYMSYIDSPNVRGLGCAFRPQGLWQPYTNLKSPPNMPNYGLGPDNSKPCWPLNLSESGESAAVEEWVIYPNPAQTQVTMRARRSKRTLTT